MNPTFHLELIRRLDELKAINDALPPASAEWGTPEYKRWYAQRHQSVVGNFEEFVTLVMDNSHPPGKNVTAEMADECHRWLLATAEQRDAMLRSNPLECSPSVLPIAVLKVLTYDWCLPVHLADTQSFGRFCKGWGKLTVDSTEITPPPMTVASLLVDIIDEVTDDGSTQEPAT